MLQETRRYQERCLVETHLTKVWRVTLVNEADSFMLVQASLVYANLPLRANNPSEYLLFLSIGLLYPRKYVCHRAAIEAQQAVIYLLRSL